MIKKKRKNSQKFRKTKKWNFVIRKIIEKILFSKKKYETYSKIFTKFIYNHVF